MDVTRWLQGIESPEVDDAVQLQIQGYQKSAQPNKNTGRSTCIRSRHSEGDSLISESRSLFGQRQPRKRLGSSNADDCRSFSGSSSEAETLHTKLKDTQRECFERRKRHKTRPALYEYGANLRKRRNRHRKQSTTKRRHENYRRTVKKPKTLNPGHNMLDRFKADNVPSERLTLKHSGNVGLFCNSKISSPKRGRGLPDLTFSGMSFLQRCHGTQPQDLHPMFSGSHGSRNQLENTEKDELGAKPAEIRQRTLNRPETATIPPSRAEISSSRAKLTKSVSPNPLPHCEHDKHFGSTRNLARSATIASWTESPGRNDGRDVFLRQRTAIDIGDLTRLNCDQPMPLEAISYIGCKDTIASKGTPPTVKQGYELRTNFLNASNDDVKGKDANEPELSTQGKRTRQSHLSQAASPSDIGIALRTCDHAAATHLGINGNSRDRSQGLVVDTPLLGNNYNVQYNQPAENKITSQRDSRSSSSQYRMHSPRLFSGDLFVDKRPTIHPPSAICNHHSELGLLPHELCSGYNQSDDNQGYSSAEDEPGPSLYFDRHLFRNKHPAFDFSMYNSHISDSNTGIDFNSLDYEMPEGRRKYSDQYDPSCDEDLSISCYEEMGLDGNVEQGLDNVCTQPEVPKDFWRPNKLY